MPLALKPMPSFACSPRSSTPATKLSSTSPPNTPTWKSPSRVFPTASKFLSAMRRNLALLRSEEHTSELQSRLHLVCRLLLEKKKELESATRLERCGYVSRQAAETSYLAGFARGTYTIYAAATAPTSAQLRPIVRPRFDITTR